MSRGLDSRNDLSTHAKELKADGIDFVARYYFRRSMNKDLLTREEASALSSAGMYIVSVWEDGSPCDPSYFSASKGAADGAMATSRAIMAGQPVGTPIYLAVDYDAIVDDLARILAYFETARQSIKQNGRTCGVYGNGIVCRALHGGGLVSHTWLSGSRGWAGYDDWAPHANLVQGTTSRQHGKDIDWDTSNGNGGGWKTERKAE